MHKFSLWIRTETEAFKDQFSGDHSKEEEGREICQCLRNIVRRIEDGWMYGAIYDRNGEKVGHWKRWNDERSDREAEENDRKEL